MAVWSESARKQNPLDILRKSTDRIYALSQVRQTIGRSVTDFTVVRRRKGSLLFCDAKCRTWPEASVRSLAAIRPESGVKPTCQDSSADAFDPKRSKFCFESCTASKTLGAYSI